MISIEQAVFTSAQTDRSAGYQIVAASPGVCEADVRELTVWGPSHDAMIRSATGATSVNFHPLPSGAYCVSRTTPAGSEYSGRRGARIYTQCLVVSPEVLGRFANNPFALLKAVSAGGSLRVYDTVPRRLDPLRLVGRATVVDESLLGQLRRDPGPRWMASLVQAALNSPAVAVAGDFPAEQIIAGLINCMPPECRTEFSFSTGLKLSSRRPFRVVALPAETDEQRRASRLYDLSVLNLADELPSEFTPTESWARLVERVLESSQVSFLGRHLSDHRDDCSLEDLPALGLQLLEELDTSLLARDPSRTESKPDETSAFAFGQPRRTNASGEIGKTQPKTITPRRGPGGSDDPNGKNEYRRGHEPHSQFQGNTPPSTPKCQLDAPSKAICPDSPEVMEKLERLDDLVYEAMSGSSEALDKLKSFWLRLRAELGVEMVVESREQYLRYALAIWEKGAGLAHPNHDRQPARAIQALDVLCVIFDED
jgi:GTPase-associated protein 1